jgi:hypothetical protein
MVLCLKRDDFRQRKAVYRVYKKTELSEENVGRFKKHYVLFAHLSRMGVQIDGFTCRVAEPDYKDHCYGMMETDRSVE